MVCDVGEEVIDVGALLTAVGSKVVGALLGVVGSTVVGSAVGTCNNFLC